MSLGAKSETLLTTSGACMRTGVGIAVKDSPAPGAVVVARVALFRAVYCSTWRRSRAADQDYPSFAGRCRVNSMLATAFSRTVRPSQKVVA